MVDTSLTVTEDARPPSQPTIYCTLCSEQAVGENALGMPVCGIPGNHESPENDAVKFY